MAQVEVKTKVTWVKGAAVFVSRYIRSKWLLRILCRFTVLKVYANGKLSKKVKLGECLPPF